MSRIRKYVPTVIRDEGKNNIPFRAKILKVCERYKGSLTNKQTVKLEFVNLVMEAANRQGVKCESKSWSHSIRDFIQCQSVELAEDWGIPYTSPLQNIDGDSTVSPVVLNGKPTGSHVVLNGDSTVSPVVLNGKPTGSKRLNQVILRALAAQYEQGKISERDLEEQFARVDSAVLIEMLK